MTKVDEITSGYAPVIEEICDFRWKSLNTSQVSLIAWAYYYFSIQFRENLEIAHGMYPDDSQLQMLVREECDTANLSPWPEIAESGEKMNHDEFMRRLLQLSPVPMSDRVRIETAGLAYLERTRQESDMAKAMSIASYECGGLEAVFKAMLLAPTWDTPLLAAFEHFLAKHIAFDSDPDAGHGALIKHLVPDERIRPLWVEFRELLLIAVPALAE